MKLTYFDGKGRAETTRIMLHSAGADWTDYRFPGTEWPAVKASTPLGSVPTLEVDGTVFTQSVSMQRYAAKLARMYPDDPLKALIVDECMDSLNELMAKAPFGGSDEERKTKRQAFQKDVMPKFFGLIESRIAKFGGGNTVCGVPSVADVHLLGMVESIQSGDWDYIDTDFFKDYPGIATCAKHIAANEKVKAYYDSKKTSTDN